jgi:hypothetical protein
VIATLAAAAAAGRVLFAAVPGVQPVTVIAIVAGASLGLRAGVAHGRAGRLRLELLPRPGHLDAAADARLGSVRRDRRAARAALRNRWMLAAVAAVLGFAFSASMDVWLWYGFFPHTLGSLARWSGAGSGSTRRTRWGTCDSRWRRGRSCAGCSTATARACGRWSCGPSPVRAAFALAVSPVSFLQAHQGANGGFGAGRPPTPGSPPGRCSACAAGEAAPGARLPAEQEQTLQTTSDVAIVALAEQALGARTPTRCSPASAGRKPSGQVGETLGSTLWAVLALGRRAPRTTNFILAQQAKAEASRGSCTASPTRTTPPPRLEALRVAHVHGAPVDEGGEVPAHVPEQGRRLRADAGRGSDAQSTAWAIQGLLAAGRSLRMQRVPRTSARCSAPTAATATRRST